MLDFPNFMVFHSEIIFSRLTISVKFVATVKNIQNYGYLCGQDEWSFPRHPQHCAPSHNSRLVQQACCTIRLREESLSKRKPFFL